MFIEFKDLKKKRNIALLIVIFLIFSGGYLVVNNMICAELAGDFHLGYARQLTDKSSLLFDLAF